MSNADSISIDLAAFLRAQRRERYPVAIVHGLPLTGKSRFAYDLAQQQGFAYLDVLAELAKQPAIVAQIDQFDVAALKALILDQATRARSDVLLIDELDFLFPIWGSDILPFQEMVRRLRHPEETITFGFFLQTRPVFEQWELLNATRTSCVIPFESIKAL